MASITPPTSITIPAGVVPFLAPCALPVTAGRALTKDTSGRVKHATNADILRANVIGFATSSTFAAGQYVAYVPPGTVLNALTGLTKNVSYYLDHGTDQAITFTLNGTPTGGTFTVSFGGVTSAAIAYNANAAAVQAALEAMSSIGAGNVSVTGASSPWTITFRKSLGAQSNALPTLANNSLTGGTSPTLAIAETVAGVADGKLAPVADLVTDNVITVLGVARSTTSFQFDPIMTGVLN